MTVTGDFSWCRQAALVSSMLAVGLILVTEEQAQAQALDVNAGSGLARQDIGIVGTSPPSCLIQPGVTAQGSNATFLANSASGGTVAISQLADPVTSQANAMSIRLALPMICNTAHSVVVRSRNGGMLRVGGSRQSSGGFTEFLPYRLSGDWVGLSSIGRSDANEVMQLSVPNGGQGLLTVDITIDQGSVPLVAGGYEDTLQIDVAASN